MLWWKLWSLKQQLTSEDSAKRGQAADKLGNLRSPKAVEPLIAALKDSYWLVRCDAARALGKIGDARAVEPLIEALKDSDKSVRRDAAAALSQIKDERVVEPLIEALKDLSEHERASIIKALEAFPTDERQRALMLVASKKWDEVRALGPGAVEPLIYALKDSEQTVRWEAAEILGKLGDTRAVEPLIAALEGSDGNLCWTAATSLGEIGDKRAVEPLIEAFKKTDYLLRLKAAEALEKLGAEEPDAQQLLLENRRRQEEAEKFEAEQLAIKEARRLKLTLAEALVFVERAIRKAGGNTVDISLVMLPVTDILQKRGIGRKIEVPKGDEPSVASLAMLIMSVLFYKEFRGLIVTDSTGTTDRFFGEGIAGSRLTPDGLAEKCGKRLFKADPKLGDYQPGGSSRYGYGEAATEREGLSLLLSAALDDPEVIVVMSHAIFSRESSYFGIPSAWMNKINSIIKVSPGLLEVYDGAGVAHLL